MFTLHCCLCTAGCGPCSVAFKTAMLVQGDLRIAHCGGFHSNLDRLITAFNVLAKLLHHNIRWDSETIGCEPSLSSIPAAEQRTLLTAMQELADWLAMPQNEKEFLIVFFDDQMDLASWVSTDVPKPRWHMLKAHVGHALKVEAPQVFLQGCKAAKHCVGIQTSRHDRAVHKISCHAISQAQVDTVNLMVMFLSLQRHIALSALHQLRRDSFVTTSAYTKSCIKSCSCVC